MSLLRPKYAEIKIWLRILLRVMFLPRDRSLIRSYRIVIAIQSDVQSPRLYSARMSRGCRARHLLKASTAS